MTETIAPEQVLKTKQNFSEYLQKNTPAIVTSTIANYQSKSGKVVIPLIDLTQNFDTLVNAINDPKVLNLPKKPYFAWIITNPKEQVMNFLKFINEGSDGELGFFVFRAFLNGDKSGLRAEGESDSVPVYCEQPRIDFECLLKPEFKIKEKKPRAITQTSGIQLDYWNAYFEVCDEMGLGDFQVQPASQHYQNIPIGVKGAYIKQTMSVKDGYVATEIFIGNDKAKYAELYKHKDEIEKELGTLIWQCLDTNKSCNIRQVIDSDLKDSETYKETAKKHIRLAELFKATFKKYL